ncbi:MAG: glutamine synthetase type III [Ruminococcaceae bacterium]|nr:glutamine synthetase type III [Oscillospiraceae bacterium]
MGNFLFLKEVFTLNNISEFFGINVFNDSVMQKMLPNDTYQSLRNAINQGTSIDSGISDAVANAMKKWAISKGATHFTHWFQPMTGITAEKHDSFITPDDNGGVIMEFSGKELIKGEPDASSFPSGGLRATFEARGYTAWDPSSYAFVKDGTLCIPTAFCSYGGEALDQKTPMLRSMEALNRQALRIVHAFGMTDVKRVNTTVGPEQEYFLIDKHLYEKRPDLVFCDRTLIGAKPPKSQEMSHHYFGVIKPRIAAFMKELDQELWKLGVLAKTEHNEAAPAQHELAPVFTTTNIAADHNQLTMELMKKVADRHGLVCILHEKPFARVNGSGKHNNWSMSTDTGINLLKPGKNPSDNILFLLSLAAVIEAVDRHQDLLRISIASAGNDHRLGCAEAPPAIVSMFLGDELLEILEAVEQGIHHDDVKRIKMNVGADVIPYIRRDNTDRNRTSPFAFTGNKFEFRMLGSSASVSETNTMLNTMVADVLMRYADRLEKANDVNSEANAIIRDTMREHKRIIFNGDGYSEEWQLEAEKRGLLNLKSTVDALPLFSKKENIELFERHGVLNATEIHSRVDIALENYCQLLNIEALTLVGMIGRDVISGIGKHIEFLCGLTKAKQTASPDINTTEETNIIKTLSNDTNKLYTLNRTLSNAVNDAEKIPTLSDKARYYHDVILGLMEEIRIIADRDEEIVATEFWPYPTYSELLFKI